MYKRILVPVDGSETASAGLREAIKLAKEQGSQIRIVHVVDEFLMVSPSVYGAVYDQFTEQMHEAGKHALAVAQGLAHEAGVTVESKLIVGLGNPAGKRVLEAVAQWGADLIVCGTHGRRGLRRIVLGSDAEYMVRHSPVPILLVRYDDRAGGNPITAGSKH